MKNRHNTLVKSKERIGDSTISKPKSVSYSYHSKSVPMNHKERKAFFFMMAREFYIPLDKAKGIFIRLEEMRKKWKKWSTE
jgi:hypothetical protein